MAQPSLLAVDDVMLT